MTLNSRTLISRTINSRTLNSRTLNSRTLNSRSKKIGGTNFAIFDAKSNTRYAFLLLSTFCVVGFFGLPCSCTQDVYYLIRLF